MNDTGKKESGYERCNRIISYIESQCNESNYVRTIGGERIKKYYILFGELHVYISDEGIEVCDSELYCNNGKLNFQDISYYSHEKIKYSLEKNKRLENCRLYFWAPERVLPGIRISYWKDSRYWAEIEEYVRDSCFLPSNIDPWNGNKPRERREEGYYSELNGDMSELLKRAILQAETEETIEAYREALDFYNRIVKIVDRDNKKASVEFWLSKLKEVKSSTPYSEEQRKCEQEIRNIMHDRNPRRATKIAIDEDEIDLR